MTVSQFTGLEGVTEKFDDYEYDVTYKVSLALNPLDHLWEIFNNRFRWCSPPLSSKCQMRENLWRERCSVPLLVSQKNSFNAKVD